MNRFQRTLGKVCENCPLCNYARKNPETRFGKVMSWHGQHCPAWKAQQELVAEREEEPPGQGRVETRSDETATE